jgi:hypothetical protein
MGVYDFEMEMCCDMQVGSLIRELELCKQTGDTKGRIVHPRYPAAPSRDTLFDSMNLYARLDDDGKVELSGAVFYRNHADGDSQETTKIKDFADIDACLEWLKGGGASDYIASKL